MDIILMLVTLFSFTSTVMAIDKFTPSIQNLVVLIFVGMLDITTFYIAFLWLSSRELLNLIEIIVSAIPYPVSYHGEYHYRSGRTKQQLV